jgi:hypothetical protein
LQGRVPEPSALAVQHQLFFEGGFGHPIQTQAGGQGKAPRSLVEALAVPILHMLLKLPRERLKGAQAIKKACFNGWA